MVDSERMLEIYKLLDAENVCNMGSGRSFDEITVMAMLAEEADEAEIVKILKLFGINSAPHRLNMMDYNLLQSRLEGCKNPKRACIRIKDAVSRMVTWGFDKEHFQQVDDEKLMELLSEIFPTSRQTCEFIMLYGCNRRVFPWNEGILRVLGRVNPHSTEKELADAISDVPPDKLKNFHSALLRLANSRCRKEHPTCMKCPLASVCEDVGKL